MIEGAHFVRYARAGKVLRWYVYAWRGGPKIMQSEGPVRPRLTREALRLLAEAHAEQNAPASGTLTALIHDYRAGPEWKALAKTTRRTWSVALDKIEAKWGALPLAIWNDPRMVTKVVSWRDSLASTPRAADIGVSVLRHLLEWARLRGVVTVNVAVGIPQLYHGGNRAEIIWTDVDIEAFCATASQQVQDALRLATFTGFRCADLASLRFEEIGERAITKTAAKVSKRRRRVVTVPIVPGLKALIEELRTRHRKPGVETVLVNGHGEPWTSGGLSQRIMIATKKAGIEQPAQPELGIEARRKHLHDVRGTFATKLILAGATDKEAADVMGWSPEQVGTIRRVYVDQARVIVAIGERISRDL